MTKPRTYPADTYPAVCIQQPYAGLIWLAGMGELGADVVIRPKRMLENTHVVIAASRRTDHEAYDRVRRILVGGGIMRLPDYEAACGRDLEGMTVAIVEVGKCRPMVEGDRQRSFMAPLFDTSGQFAWRAETIAALAPFETKNAQVVFQVQREIVDATKRRVTTRAQRNAQWKALAKRREHGCECGATFPKHIAEFMNLDPRASHVCRCGVEYVVKRNKFVVKEQQTEVTP